MRLFVSLILACAVWFIAGQAHAEIVANVAVDSFFTCLDGVIQFTAGSSTGNPTHVFWDWTNNGSYDEGGTIDPYGYRTHSWDSGGTYYVKVLVQNRFTFEEDDIVVGPFYVGEVIIIPSTYGGESPLSVDFDATYSRPASPLDPTYEWDYDSNGESFSWQSSDGTETHVYEEAGDYSCYFRVTWDDNPDWRCIGYVTIHVE